MDKDIILFKEFEKLEESGIYVFLNKEKNTFYVGKGTPLIGRIKYHLHKNSIEKVKYLVRDIDTELYIYPIRNRYNLNEKYNQELLLIEYASYVYLVELGYISINNSKGFSSNTKTLYLREKYRLNMKEILNFNVNIFQKRFRNFLENIYVTNVIKSKNETLDVQVKILKKQNDQLLQTIEKLNMEHIENIRYSLKLNINEITKLYFNIYKKLIKFTKFEIYPDCKYSEYIHCNEVLFNLIELLKYITDNNKYESLDLKNIIKIFMNLGSAYGFLESIIYENYYDDKLHISYKYLEDIEFIMVMIYRNIKQLDIKSP